MSAEASRLPAGTVGKAHGLDGSFYVVGAVTKLLTKGGRIWLDGEDEPREIQRLAGTGARPILKLSGAATRTAAEALRGRTLQLDAEAAPPLGDDEYWQHELVGCTVRSRDGRTLGTVDSLLGLPSCEALVVTGTDKELLIPLVRDAIDAIDTDRRQITVDAEFLALED